MFDFSIPIFRYFSLSQTSPGFSGSKEFQNSYSSFSHFALVLQLDKEGKSTGPDQVFPCKNEWTSGFFELWFLHLCITSSLKTP